MELTLNIYKGKEIEKTYTASEFDLMFGTVEDVVALIDVDKFSDNAEDMAFIGAVTKMISGGMEQVKELLKEIFPGLTDEEIKRTKVRELVPLFVDVIRYSVNELASISSKKK